MFAKLFRRKYVLRLKDLYIDRGCWIKVRGDWHIVDRNTGRVEITLTNFARFQAKRACRLWNRFSK
jgi:hypothetical protein